MERAGGSSSTIYTTTKEAEPVIFKSAFDAEQHFRKQYLPQLVKSAAMTVECSGQASRAGGDRFVTGAVRAAWEKESHFPQQIVNGLRSYFVDAGLHFFKHRKRVLYVSATKPQRHPRRPRFFPDGHFRHFASGRNHAAAQAPGISPTEDSRRAAGRRRRLRMAQAKNSPSRADLHYLIHAGHVIEFGSNGMPELPLAPQEKPATERPGKPAPSGSAAPALEASAIPEAGERDLELVEPEPGAGSRGVIRAPGSRGDLWSRRMPWRKLSPSWWGLR